MISRIQLVSLVIVIQGYLIAAWTDPKDVAALKAIKSHWNNLPPNWAGSDPCSSGWEGISCNGSRVTSITLAGTGLTGSNFGDISAFTELQYLDLSNNIGLKGTLPSSIGNLQNLWILILVGCGFFGPIPDSIGSLPNLIFLSLNSNSFSGPIPPSIGNLANLSWLDLSNNQLSGTIPVSNGIAPGLDMLLNAKHFHLSRNQLSGSIQPQLLSSNMKLIHLILNNNKLSGHIPLTLGSVQTLEVVRLDWNSLNGSVPSNLNNLTNVNELFLSNNDLTGPIPNLTGINVLYYVDMSNNSFIPSAFPTWLTSIQSLTTLVLNWNHGTLSSQQLHMAGWCLLKMENTKIQGQIPVNFFSLPQLETVVLRNNQLNGTLDIGNSYRSNLSLDLQNNFITDFQQKTGYNMELTLIGNPICGGNGATEKYCTPETSTPFSPSSNCSAISCNSDEILSPTCQCSHPYVGTLHFTAYSFSDLKNVSYFRTLAGSLISTFKSNGLPVDSVEISSPSIDVYSYLQFRLQIFPAGQDVFNRTSISTIGFLLNRQPFLLQYFGPFFFIDESYCCFSGEKKKSLTGTIVGASVGGVALLVLILFGGFYAYQSKRPTREAVKNDPFANWDPDHGNGSVPELKGAKWFSFEELRKCTHSFSESNCIGFGGYGKVYKATLASGQLVAIKRAQQGSMQGAVEFKTEIELLSRIHHKNVVSLVGFCYDQGEQMLVYEYISSGALRESLSGKSGIQLDWMRRLTIALDAARGLAYLHELADPPIIHRDIKSNNILLDDHLNAKVADFGLSKLLGDEAKGYVTTQVKGTLGYMDPEYYMTQQLTDKSDVYSFGVVLLELITARAPIERGKHIVTLVHEGLNNPNDASNFSQLLDPKINTGTKLGGIDKFIDLAMRCVLQSGADRPTMGEVVREIENILQLATMKKDVEKGLILFNYEDTTDASLHHSYGSRAFDYSGGIFAFNLEHHQ